MVTRSDSSRGTSVPSSRLLSIGEVSKKFGVGLTTIRNAASSGELRCYRIGLYGHRRFDESDVSAWMGRPPEERSTRKSKVIIYGRVSTQKQGAGFSKGEDSDLSRQIERLQVYGSGEYGIKKDEIEIYSDIASGLSFTRKGFTKLVANILKGNLDGCILLVTHKDRIARFGTELFLEIAKHHDIEIVFTEADGETSDEEELASDVLAIITCFSSRAHSKRAKQTICKALPVDAIERARFLYQNQLNLVEITKCLNEEGYTTDKGTPCTTYLVKKYLITNKDLVEQVMSDEAEQEVGAASSFHRFHDEHIVPVEEKLGKNGKADTRYCRLCKQTMYAEYEKWCKEHDEWVLSYKKVGILMKDYYKYEHGLVAKKLHYRRIQLRSVLESLRD